jgi:hypothetical protein
MRTTRGSVLIRKMDCCILCSSRSKSLLINTQLMGDVDDDVYVSAETMMGDGDAVSQRRKQSAFAFGASSNWPAARRFVC